MKIRFYLLLLLSLLAVPAAAQPDADADAQGLKILGRDGHGVPTFVSGKLGFLSKGDRGRAAAAFLRTFAEQSLGATGTENLEVRRVREDHLGKLHVRVQQRINDLPVVGAELILHSDAKTGEVYAVNGRFIPDTGLPLEPKVDPEKALATAYITAGIREPKVLEGPELTYVVDSAEYEAHLAWSVLVAYEDSEGVQQIDRVFADAIAGGLVDRHPQIHTVRTRETYNANNTTTLPGTLAIRETETSTDNVLQTIHDNAGRTYDYYWGRFGRDSINGLGMTIISTGHYGSSYNNAHGSSTQVYYGDGDGTRFAPLGNALDVVAHEMTHAVIDFESDLIYKNESGALNESLADVFGAAVESWTDGGLNGDTWKIGEDVYTPATAGDALRYMDNPTRDGSSKDYYPERYTGADDEGGVHYNSGISNMAFHRLVAGGGHPRFKNHFNVTGIGMSKAEAIFYRAQTEYLISTSDFQGMRNATLRAAEDLYGVNSAERGSVNMAWCVVGVFGTGCPPSNISGSGTIFAGRRRATVSWLTHGWPAFDVFRDGVKVGTTYSSYYSDSFVSSAFSANYWVCWAGATTWYDSRYCSNVTTVGFSYP
ncbi:MAG TPA: M4 family metallopeptidase [Thermoanaerobaculia bacterium]|nr:M4 family metallopeptidase [Thermoanaerobaculia bacterium]